MGVFVCVLKHLECVFKLSFYILKVLKTFFDFPVHHFWQLSSEELTLKTPFSFL